MERLERLVDMLLSKEQEASIDVGPGLLSARNHEPPTCEFARW